MNPDAPPPVEAYAPEPPALDFARRLDAILTPSCGSSSPASTASSPGPTPSSPAAPGMQIDVTDLILGGTNFDMTSAGNTAQCVLSVSDGAYSVATGFIGNLAQAGFYAGTHSHGSTFIIY